MSRGLRVPRCLDRADCVADAEGRLNRLRDGCEVHEIAVSLSVLVDLDEVGEFLAALHSEFMRDDFGSTADKGGGLQVNADGGLLDLHPRRGGVSIRH